MPGGHLGDKFSRETFQTRSIGKAIQSGQSGKSCQPIDRENTLIGPIGKSRQSGQSGNPANRESTPIWPIGTTGQSRQSEKPCNQDYRESFAIRKSHNRGNWEKHRTANQNELKDIAQHLPPTGNRKSLPLRWLRCNKICQHQTFCLQKWTSFVNFGLNPLGRTSNRRYA